MTNFHQTATGEIVSQAAIMPHTVSKPRKPKSRVLGAKAFAAITAVEDLRLSAVSRKRLDALKAAGLSPDERRAEVLRAYTGLGRRK